MPADIQTYRRMLEQKKGETNQINKELSEKEKLLGLLKRDIRNTEDAQMVVQTVAQETQKQLEYHISDMVSLALNAVFDDPYEFKVNFIQKRGKTEAEILFKREGKEIDPMTEAGGGAVDVAAFALRIALWNIRSPRSRNTILLDEPFRFLSRELQPKAGEMFQMLSEKLGLQFIVVTHNPDLIEVADKVFKVEIKNGVSRVKEER